MDTVFNAQPQPHAEAIALIKGRKPVAARVFYGLLPELRSRAFTVSGVEGASVLQRIRDSIAGLPAGQTWDDVKGSLVDDLSPFLGEGAERRAEMLLRTSGFQAFTSATYRTAQEDDDTTHLQYIHGDQAEVPTPSHEALDGIVLPKDDPFWENHTGPWGHIGCVCYVRPMNPDLVDVERARDEGKDAPEDRNVLDDRTAENLRNGHLTRGGRSFWVAPPEGKGAFQWHPDDLRLPVGDVLQRYDEETQADFTTWARNTFVGPDTTAWNWLNSAPAAKRSAAEIRRQDRRTVRKQLENAKISGIGEPEYGDPAELSRDSQRFFTGGAEAFSRHERDWGATLEGPILQSLAEEWRAQIAAVATGRKPLFHEQFLGDAAPKLAIELRKLLPDTVAVHATGDALYIYRPDVISRLANPGQPLWEQVKAHSDDGVWLGYGVNLHTTPSVRVTILDPQNRVVSGFYAPKDAPEKFARDRADDFTLATGRQHTARIIPHGPR